MKKFITFLIGGILLTGAVGCGEEAAKTGSENPSATNENSQPAAREASETEGLNQPGAVPGAETAPVDPTGVTSADANPLESDLSKEVSQKLKEKLPTSQLEVKEAEGVVSVGGTVSSPEELQQIEPLTKEVKGVKGVNVEANVADGADSANPAEGTANPQ